jgi:hypothetical protein
MSGAKSRKATWTMIVVAVFVLGGAPSLGSHAAAAAAAAPGVLIQAQPGDSASGRVVTEGNNRLSLDASCDGSRLIQFVAPYTKDDLGQAKCGDTAYDRVHVTQK